MTETLNRLLEQRKKFGKFCWRLGKVRCNAKKALPMTREGTHYGKAQAGSVDAWKAVYGADLHGLLMVEVAA